jgi:catechol 2,3-dioxygenase-like lactoylglutathione lyase family enzyme
MAEKTIDAQTFCQVALVVKDIEATAKKYADLFGVEVPEVRMTGTQEETNARYRGEPTPARAKLAFFDLGTVNMELIEPVGRPSTWNDFLEKHGEGVHHLAFRFKDNDRVIKIMGDQGCPVEHQGEYPGGRFTYLDTEKDYKVVLELLENFDT